MGQYLCILTEESLRFIFDPENFWLTGKCPCKTGHISLPWLLNCLINSVDKREHRFGYTLAFICQTFTNIVK